MNIIEMVCHISKSLGKGVIRVSETGDVWSTIYMVAQF